MRRLLTLCALAACHAPAPAGSDLRHPEPPPSDPDAQRGVDYLNAVRAAHGLPPVTLDPEMSRGAAAHARYLTLNAGRAEIAGLAAHHEVATLPGATPAGADAGEHGVIEYMHADAPGAIDTWLATLYHRIPLLRRDVQRIGLGGDGAIHVLSVAVAPTPRAAPVLAPYDHQTAVPTHFAHGEIPDPRPAAWSGTGYADAVEYRTGYPVTVTFDPAAQIAGVRAELVGPEGAVAAAVSSPEAPALAFPQGNVVAVLPRHPLAPGATYHARVTYTEGGAPRELAWTFATAAARPWSSTNGGPLPALSSAVSVTGLVDSAYPTLLCDDAAHTRCKEHVVLALARAAPADAEVKVEVTDAGADRARLLGLVGRGVAITGTVDAASAAAVTLGLADARGVALTEDRLPVIAAAALTPADRDRFVWVTGTLGPVVAKAGAPVFAQLGRARVYVQFSAETWRAVGAPLVGRAIRVRGRVRDGQPVTGALYVYASDAGQIERAPK